MTIKSSDFAALPVGDWRSRCENTPEGHWFAQDGPWTVQCEECGL